MATHGHGWRRRWGRRPTDDRPTHPPAGFADCQLSEALEFEYGDPEDRHIYRELQELKPLVQQALDGTNPTNQED